MTNMRNRPSSLRTFVLLAVLGVALVVQGERPRPVTPAAT